MPSERWIPTAERGCLALLLLWLIWIPLPFASIVPGARIPLILTPLLLCAIAASIRLYSTRDRNSTAQPTLAWIIWGNGALIFLVVGALQLVPLPSSLHAALSPESHSIWSAATRIATLAGVRGRESFPMTIDPQITKFELLRLTALFATFTTAAILIRTHSRRVALASALCIAAMFETLYGVREAALQRYEIWGWVNRLIFNRVTGTFVNPNHFAHYLAIVFPMALFLIAAKWRLSGDPEMPASRRFMNLLEHGAMTAGFALLAAISCVAGILVAQSRGALLALSAGVLIVASMLPGRRLLRISFAAAGVAVVVLSLIWFLGTQRTVARFIPTQFERETLVGRRIGISAAVGVWERFPLFGSGLGTFERVVSMEQKDDLTKLYHHAHNDFVEIAATTGTVGFVVALVTLIGGYVVLARSTFGDDSRGLSWRRRAYQAAALASVTIAAVHALVDFNFFIPSNAATLAAIAGAAVSSVDHDKRTRR